MELKSNFEALSKSLVDLGKNLDLSQKKLELKKLQDKTASINFWHNDNTAKKTMKQIASIEDLVNSHSLLAQKIQENLEILTLADLENEEIDTKELTIEYKKLKSQLSRLKTKSLLAGKYDSGDAILTVFSGQGGTEAMDWAAMLARMYQRYFEKADFKHQVSQESLGEEAGIKSKTFIVTGKFAYGYLKGEAGTHRLVRLSPFNADNLRQTSFAGVEVLPVLEEDTQVEVKNEDLDWQFYRSSGKGGQNVNKVSTAVRLTHKPSGITVTSQTQRQQQQNRKIALDVLKSKLWHQNSQKRDLEQQSVKGSPKLAGWGNQIRSYVLHPYHLVKDLRTGVETSNTEAVLDGDISNFIQAQISKLPKNISS